MLEDYIPYEGKNGITILMPTDRRRPIKYRFTPKDNMTMDDLLKLQTELQALTGTREEPKVVPKPDTKVERRRRATKPDDIPETLCMSCVNKECLTRGSLPAGVGCDLYAKKE